jgi:SAM-dependent methyltransferase
MQPELYHAHHILHQEDLPFWIDLAQQSRGPVLELGCGTGRVLAPLALAGYQLAGIDHDMSMLQFARHLMSDIIPSPWLVAADLRRFYFDINFPLIILPCNTYSTLDQPGRLACLEHVHRHLSPGGCFTFSMPNPVYLSGLPACSRPELEDEFIHPSTGNPVQVSSAWQRTSQLFILTWLYDQLLPNGKAERTSETIAHQLVSAEIYLDEVRLVGFKVSRLFGDFDGSDYEQESPNLICVCIN